MVEFDHIAISGETLNEAVKYVEDALGVKLQGGGQHDVFNTHNALLGLEDGLYLEAIAINPEAPQPARPRWFDLDNFAGPPRLTNWICRVDDLHSLVKAATIDFGTPVDLQRGDLRWQMAVPATGILPFDSAAPALIHWQTDLHPSTMLSPSGCRLNRLTISHPNVDALADVIGSYLMDDRIAFETGPKAMSATFQTPHGSRELLG
ncbi:MAG: VOC family protein [Aliishimia sp.]